ncbi:MAG TPA: YlmC/YmxH family sporulation protein [Candidatus Onthovicinus excrementipullorum]|nr:YlmC/YmxH family sporulation protein [Candidatus Onthovicinus excrementipullorum]
MDCRLTDLNRREVVNVNDATRIGSVIDVFFDMETGKMTSIVVGARKSGFGVFGRDEDALIEWDKIKVIGEDTILVDYTPPKQAVRRGKNYVEGLFK